MVSANTESQRTAFTVSVDARNGTTTGISASDRAATVQALVDPATGPKDLNRPGHIFPLRYRPGGVLKRAGHTEASRRSGHDGRNGAGRRVVRGGERGQVPDGQPRRARSPGPARGSSPYIDRGSRPLQEPEREVASRGSPDRSGSRASGVTSQATRTARCSTESSTSQWWQGRWRVSRTSSYASHSECLTGDVFGSLRCDCGPQLHAAFGLIAQEGSGVVVYLRGHEGRGIGLAHKLRAYSLQEQGRDTVDANLELGLPVDSREYGIGAQILVDLGVTTMRVMTNNPMKYTGLDGFGLDVVGRVPLNTAPNPENHAYLKTKRDRLGHLLTGLDVPAQDGVVLDDLSDQTSNGASADASHLDPTSRLGSAGRGTRGARTRLTSDESTKLGDSDRGSIASRGVDVVEGHPRGAARPTPRVWVLCAKFNGGISARLCHGALDAFDSVGMDSSSVSVAWVPGAFELPLSVPESDHGWGSSSRRLPRGGHPR